MLLSKNQLLPIVAMLAVAACKDVSQPATGPTGTSSPMVGSEKSHEGLLVAREDLPGFLAQATGTLTMRRTCVVLDDAREPRIVVWPAGTVWKERSKSIEVPNDDQSSTIYVLGRRYTLVGGGVSSFDGGSPGLGPPNNPNCNGPAWIASTLLPAGD